MTNNRIFWLLVILVILLMVIMIVSMIKSLVNEVIDHFNCLTENVKASLSQISSAFTETYCPLDWSTPPSFPDVLSDSAVGFLANCCQLVMNQHLTTKGGAGATKDGDLTTKGGAGATGGDLTADSPWPNCFLRSQEIKIKGRLHGLILELEDYSIVAFRGTADSSDLWTDFQAKQCNFQSAPGLVHQGFYQLHLACRSVLKTIPNRPIVCVGHSLGGVLAIFAYLYLRGLRPEAQLRLMSLAHPRFGDKIFFQHLNQVLVRDNQVARERAPGLQSSQFATRDGTRTTFGSQSSDQPTYRLIVNMSDLVPQFPTSTFIDTNGSWYYYFGHDLELIDFQKGNLIDNHSLASYRDYYLNQDQFIWR